MNTCQSVNENRCFFFFFVFFIVRLDSIAQVLRPRLEDTVSFAHWFWELSYSLISTEKTPDSCRNCPLPKIHIRWNESNSFMNDVIFSRTTQCETNRIKILFASCMIPFVISGWTVCLVIFVDFLICVGLN